MVQLPGTHYWTVNKVDPREDDTTWIQLWRLWFKALVGKPQIWSQKTSNSSLSSTPSVSLCVCLVTQSCPTLCDPMDCSPPGSFCPWGFSRQEYWSGLPCPSPGDPPNPVIQPRSPTLQTDSLQSEPAGKLKNTGLGSLYLLQGNFPTPKSN